MNSWPDLDHALLADLLKQLVRIPSQSNAAGGEEGAVQRFVARRLAETGARVRVLTVDDLGHRLTSHPLFHGPDRQYNDRPTVVAELGPADGPALLVLAHSDTVPLFRPDEWTVDPFAAEERDGKIYGLGVTDDKWGLATLLAMAAALRETQLPKRLIFVSTIDEENGVGNGMLLLHLSGVHAESALYLDGYGMIISIGCLGGSNLYLRATEVEVDADRFAADVSALRGTAEALSRRRSALFDRDGFRENDLRGKSVQIHVRADDRGAIRLPFYTLPGEDRGAVQAEIEQMVERALGSGVRTRYTFTYREPWFEPFVLGGDVPLIRYLSRAADQVRGQPPVITTISKQDSFVLVNHARIPTVSFGPTMRTHGRGAFHSPDEFLTLQELRAGADIAYRAITRWLTAG